MTVAAWLVVFQLASTAGSWTAKAFPMPDLQACRQSVAAARVDLPQSGDAEAAIAFVCVADLRGALQIWSDGHWHTMEINP